jgi:hydroxyacylglutathione hydrolase
MKFYPQIGNNNATNGYMVADENAKVAVIFDAPKNTTQPSIDEAVKNGWDVIGLWITHGHFDHLGDHKLVTDRFPKAKVLMHRLDEHKLQQPGHAFMKLPWNIPGRNVDGYVEDDQKLMIGSAPVIVLFTPGHSPGHVMFHLPQHDILIGGDLIFANSIGRTDFPDCDQAELMKSIRRVMQLPPQTRLYPGHGPSATLAELKESNPFVIEAMQG